jgi:hypothetical protein
VAIHSYRTPIAVGDTVIVDNPVGDPLDGEFTVIAIDGDLTWVFQGMNHIVVPLSTVWKADAFYTTVEV